MSVVDRQEIEAAYRAEREAEDPKAWEKEYLEDCRIWVWDIDGEQHPYPNPEYNDIPF
jgi:hypothetical protein